MKKRNFVDKSKFGNGAWQTEADSYTWTDEKTGYLCHVWRNSETGCLCGYVGINDSHPFYGKDYGDKEIEAIRAHGGVNFSNCVSPGIPDREDFDNCLWYFGFDCAHAWDLWPYMRGDLKESSIELGAVYRDFNYVKEQVESLAMKLKIYETTLGI